MKDSNHEQVMQLLREAYAEADNQVAVRAEWLAEQVRARLDPDRSNDTLISYSAVLQWRQMARSICRRECGVGEDDGQQTQLFDGQLQRRYPVTRGKEEQYILRDHMVELEYVENIRRLSQEAASKARHADALQAELDARRQRGDFAISA